jgi:hypothetical protein
MKDRLVVSALIVAGCLAAMVMSPRAQQQPFRARTDAVSVTVSVMKGNEPVAGLTAADFELTDNGFKQNIEAASLEQVPIDVTIAISGGSARYKSGLVEGVIQADRLRSLLRPDDRLRRVTIGDQVRGALVSADARFYEGNAPQTTIIPGISLIDGVFYVLAWPVEPGRRHLAIVYTAGEGRYSTLEPNRLPDLASRSDAVMHLAVWASPNETDSRPAGGPDTAISDGLKELMPPSMTQAQRSYWQETYGALEQSVRRTGGTVRRVSDSLKTFSDIVSDFRSSYVLQYAPQGVAPAGWHELKVKVLKPGTFTIRARKGYEG